MRLGHRVQILGFPGDAFPLLQPRLARARERASSNAVVTDGGSCAIRMALFLEGTTRMRWKFAILAVGLALAGCNADSADQRTLGGAAIGAGTGAVIGGVTGGGRGAAIGAAVGGVTGAVIGRATTP